MRDKPVTFAEELLESFTGSDSFSKKLDIAIEFVNNIDTDEGSRSCRISSIISPRR